MNVLRARFQRPKDKPSVAQTRGVVYKIVCSDSDFVNYEQMDRALQTRIKEHKRAVRVNVRKKEEEQEQEEEDDEEKEKRKKIHYSSCTRSSNSGLWISWQTP